MSLAAVPSSGPTLAELEAVIERGLHSFVDVGNALLAIKIDKRYREAGYSTFEDYCDRRWQISARHGQRLAIAAATAEQIAREIGPGGPIPATEKQVRPLAALPSPEAKADAWTEAVESAGGEQPTAAQVEAAVERRRLPTPPRPPVSADDEMARARAEAVHAKCVALHRFVGNFAGLDTAGFAAAYRDDRSSPPIDPADIDAALDALAVIAKEWSSL